MGRKRIWLVVLLLLSIVLVACGGEEEWEDEPEEQVPVAVDLEEPVEDEEPPADSSRAVSSQVYQHPSGAFAVDWFSTDYEETDSGVIFYDDDSSVMVDYGEVTGELDPEASVQLADELAVAYLGQVTDSFFTYPDEAEIYGDGYLVYFEYDDEEGEIYLVQVGDVYYAMMLMTADYGEAEDQWLDAVDSLEPLVEIAENEPSAPPAAEVEPSETPATDDAGPAVAGEGVQNGFDPTVHGFNFWNYGDEEDYTNLTPAEVQRLFGDQVCASTAGGECILTPPGREWMEQVNGYMSGGHCEGMAVLSTMMYYGLSNPANFGGQVAHQLNIENEALQREIAYWFVTQGTYPGTSVRVDASPNAVLDALIEAFSDGFDANEWWVMGIYQPDFTGGHAITPFGVVEKGDGLYHILVYDNNWPDETRIVEVDRNANTWKYQASINPDEPSELYEGDADTQTLEVVAISTRLDPQECPFCDDAYSGMSRTRGLADSSQAFYEIWLQGPADLLIMDDQDRRIGFVDGVLVNEIPGAQATNFKFQGVSVWEADSEPIYRVPVGVSFDIVVDGSRLQEPASSEVAMIGPGYFLSVEDIWLEPGEQDSIGIYIDGGRHQLTYITDYIESPVIMMGVETEAADYAFLVQATEMTGLDDTFDVAVDFEVGDFIINTSYNEGPSTFDYLVLRIDDDGEHVFGGSGLVLEPENTIYLPYLDWEEDGSILAAGIDFENDGEIDEFIELIDEADEFYSD